MAIEGREKCLGLTIKPRQRGNVKDEKVTDLNFADRIALFSLQFQQAQELLRNVEEASAKVVLLPNAKKTCSVSVTIMLMLRSKHETTK